MKKFTLNVCKPAPVLAAVLLLCPLLAQAECSVTSSSSVLDYGTLNTQATPSAQGRVLLAPRDVRVQVDCDEPQQMQLSFGSARDNANGFAFGRDGYLQVTLSGLTIDNHATSLMDFSAGAKNNGGRQQGARLLPGSQIAIVDRGQHLTFTLTLRPTFSDRLFSVQDDTDVGNDLSITLN